MKKIILFLSLIVITGCSWAQKSAAVKNPPVSIQAIPNFRILSKDSVYITNANLKKGKPVMFIYFSPDCSHCQRLMYELKPQMEDFKNIQIVMVTFIQSKLLKMLKEFHNDYIFAAQPNVLMGTEYPDYKLQRYYSVATTPYIAIYGRNGKLVEAFDKVPKVSELTDAVKQAE
ncbi:TlpA family protein disulfide reductase [Mucilaginibacter sp.]